MYEAAMNMSTPSTASTSVYGDETSDTFSDRTPSTQSVVIEGRPVKLRSSCDECAAAKVRCNKAHPECIRCLTGGMKCVYGPSRKFGKPRKKAAIKPDRKDEEERDKEAGTAKANPMPPPISHPNPPNDSIWDDIFQDVGGDGELPSAWPTNGNGNGTWAMPVRDPYSHLNPLDIDACADLNLNNDFVDINPMLDASLPSPHDMYSNFQQMSSSFDSFQDHPILTGPANTVSYNQTHSPEMPMSPEFVAPTNIKTPRPPVSNAQKLDTHKCDELAYSTLETLEFRHEKNGPYAVHTSHDGATPSLDSILAQNKAAINAILKLLDCPCAQDSHLAMLYASITSKILIWYQVAAGFQSQSNLPGSISDSPITPLYASWNPKPSFAANSPVPPAHVSLGSFKLDEKDEEAFRKYLLLRELTKLGQVIERFGSAGAKKGFGGGVGDLYTSLGRWLKSEFTRTLGVLKAGIAEVTDELLGL